MREPSKAMMGQKFKNSPMAVRSESVVLPALAEILAVSAMTLSVRSGAKSKTKHSSFTLPLIVAGVCTLKMVCIYAEAEVLCEPESIKTAVQAFTETPVVKRPQESVMV